MPNFLSNISKFDCPLYSPASSLNKYIFTARNKFPLKGSSGASMTVHKNISEGPQLFQPMGVSNSPWLGSVSGRTRLTEPELRLSDQDSDSLEADNWFVGKHVEGCCLGLRFWGGMQRAIIKTFYGYNIQQCSLFRYPFYCHAGPVSTWKILGIFPLNYLHL